MRSDSPATTGAEHLFYYLSNLTASDCAVEAWLLWGHVTEAPVLERIDRWVKNGGIIFYPMQPRGLLMTVEGDSSAARQWQNGDTGKGEAIFYLGDSIPGEPYARFIRARLLKFPGLRSETQAALRLEKPDGVFWSVLENGKVALLNFSDDETSVRLANGKSAHLEPYAIALE